MAIDPSFPATVHPLPGDFSSRPKAFVLKVDPSGNTIYSTFFGGTHGAPITGTGIGLFGSGPGSETEEDRGVAVAVDAQGNAYVTGYTSAIDFPTTAGAYQTKLADGCPYAAFEINTGLIGVIAEFFMDDVFVVKLSPDGSTALYSTLIGGGCFDHPISIAVDASGRALVTGETDSFDFPLVAAAKAAPPYGLFASFLSVLNASGSALDFSTYLYSGASSFAAAGSNGSVVVGGSVGPNAQTVAVSGAYSALVNPTTHGYLAVAAPPALPTANLTQVRNAFSLRPGPIAAGEIVALTIPGFTPDQAVDMGLKPSAPLTTSLAGVQVSFDGVAAYLISVASEKIVCIAPLEIAGEASTGIQVTVNGASSNVLSASVAATALGLMSADGSGTGQANALNADGSVNSAANPAPVGSQVTVYLTGAGVSANVVPVANLAIFPSNGSLHSLADFVPGIFAYTFTVPASASVPFSVLIETSAYSNQSLQVSIQK